MKNIITRCLVFWVFSGIVFHTSNCKAQNLETTVKIADSLFLYGQYKLSIDLYKRVLFFDKKETFDSIVFSQLAKSYFQLKEYENAATYFGHSYSISEDVDYLFDQVLCQILAGNFKLAKLTLLITSSDQPITQSKKAALLSLVEFKLKNFQDSEKHFKAFQDLNPNVFIDFSAADITQKSSKIQKRYKKSKVRLMSFIFPGLGQMYCGDFKEGFNSLGVAVLFGGAYTKVANSLSIFDAVLTVLPWYQRYYVGGINKAGKIAEHKQQELLNLTFNEMISAYEKTQVFVK